MGDTWVYGGQARGLADDRTGSHQARVLRGHGVYYLIGRPPGSRTYVHTSRRSSNLNPNDTIFTVRHRPSKPSLHGELAAGLEKPQEGDSDEVESNVALRPDQHKPTGGMTRPKSCDALRPRPAQDYGKEPYEQDTKLQVVFGQYYGAAGQAS
ncbi:hypothetical protein K458DRAFT_487146 [Lentithecium fluviatile CBS 122367]|uniref:Uncharacterized protein n=1 Tax=Lentithecium fluviatile CBS 122367 TaxID=1168545 RepID=A0A6G1J2Z5_9PLEO|nr:hypothetical protein K458DRAFT_487146 [Lentithecium fluviatile CBS 122367]